MPSPTKSNAILSAAATAPFLAQRSGAAPQRIDLIKRQGARSTSHPPVTLAARQKLDGIRLLGPSNRELLRMQRPCSCREVSKFGSETGRSLQAARTTPAEDPLEREADKIADLVMRGDAKDTAVSPVPAGGVSSNPEFSPQAMSKVRKVVSSPGNTLGDADRSFFESRINWDFSDIRVHTDSASAESADEVNALAYTVGHHIVFGNGQFSPQTSDGRRLIAHELVHTMHQSIPGQINRKCGPKSIGRNPPLDCTLDRAEPDGTRFLFDVNCDTFRPGQESQLRDFAADPSMVPDGAEIEVTGIASSDGPADFNDALACARARVVASILKERHGARVGPIRATGGIGKPHDQDNRAVAVKVRGRNAPNPQKRASKAFKVVAKSYIADIGTDYGWLPFRCHAADAAFQPSLNCQNRLGIFAPLTRQVIHGWENPTTAALDGAYRLFSKATIRVSCDGGGTDMRDPIIYTDVGQEDLTPMGLYPVRPDPIEISERTFLRTGTGIDFSWTAAGQPHWLAESGFQAVCPRSSMKIWHHVSAHIECGRGDPTITVGISGSRFPSHRVFLDGQLANASPQGLFSRLWYSKSGDISRVE